MYKSVPLLFCTLISLLAVASLNVLAQDHDSWSYEQITFHDGATEKYYVHYDSFKEWLYFESEEGEVRYFIAEDLTSFTYRDSLYYSLPFESGMYSFFKVEYEGSKTALLSKPNSLNLMQYLAKRYDKIYNLRTSFQGKTGYQLCRINWAGLGLSSSVLSNLFYSNYNPHRVEKYLDPVEIKKCLFVAGEKGIEIFQLDVDQEIMMGLFTKNKKFDFESLEDFFGKENYRKMHHYARENKLKEHQLEDLKEIIRYYDSI